MLKNKGSSCGRGSVFPKESSKNNSLRAKGNVTGEAGTGNNNTVSDGEFHPVITGLQQRASHFQEFYKMIIKHSHLCNWP